MKIEFNIANDKELRDYIKNLIKGQVLSVARKEIKNIISDKHIGNNYTDVQSFVRSEIRKIIKEEVDQ